MATGAFHVSNGKIIDPNGNEFIARGINVYDAAMGQVSTSSNVTPLLSLFPGLNMVRLNCYQYNDPSFYQTFIDQLTAKNIVVELEDHTGISSPPYSGSQLQTESNWYANLAAAYKNNPYVWFGTFNEPGGQNGPQAVTDQEVATYNAVRGAGNNNPVMFELIGGGNPDTLGAFNASVFASMTNVIWDLHQYDWTSQYSTDQTTIANALAGFINTVQQNHSADGVVPVIIGEYGISTDGNNVDAGGTQLCRAVQASGKGSLAWNWYSDAGSDNLTDNNNNLTSYGQQVASWIASAASHAPTPVPTPHPTPTPAPSGVSPLIQGPIPGATRGTWQAGDLPANGIAGGKFHYNFLLPHNYSPSNSYPVLVYEHENSEGVAWYTGQNSDPLYLISQPVMDGAFNDPAFRAAYPCIVICPYADQSKDSGGETSNFGGYNDSPGSDPNEQAVTALVKWFIANYSVFPGKIYITGDSLGGIGTLATMLDYNAYNGPVDKVFTAGLSYAGQIYRNSNPAQDSATIARMSKVPLFSVSGSGDTTSPPATYNQPMWQHYAGNSNYPGGPAGGQAGSSSFHYLEDPGLGHDVWDTYRQLPGGKPMYDWLFAQTSGAVAVPTATPHPTPTVVGHPSPNNTVVLAGSSAVITDASGNAWSITSGQQIAVNGSPDTMTANVTKIAYVNGLVWQENTSNLWWSKTSPSAGWSPPAGTSVSPIAGTTPTPVPTPAPTTPVPTVPPAGGNLKDAIIAWMAGLKGKHVISIQHLGGRNQDMTTPNTVHSASGQWVGGIGGGYYDDSGMSNDIGYEFNPVAIQYWNAGGLVTVSHGWGNPNGGGALTTGNVDGNALITPGSSTYNAWLQILDQNAIGLQQLKDAGVVVLLRPLHEMNGNWNWWGTGISDQQFIQLWQITYNYLVHTKGLNNLIWIYSPNGGMGDHASRYPGDAYVDITGFDVYTSDPNQAVGDYNAHVQAFNKPVAYCEFGPGTANSGDNSFDQTVLINDLKANMPNAIYWCQWWERWGMDKVQNISAALNDPYVLNRGNLGRPVAGTSTPTPVPVTVPTPAPTPVPTPVPTVPKTPTPPSGATVLITPGHGSFTDSKGNVYTLDATGHALENGTQIPGGPGTGVMVYYAGQVYGQDAASKGWYIWNQSTWTSASAPVLPVPSVPTAPTPTPVPKTPTPVPTAPTPVPTPHPTPTPTPVVTHVSVIAELTQLQTVIASALKNVADVTVLDALLVKSQTLITKSIADVAKLTP